MPGRSVRAMDERLQFVARRLAGEGRRWAEKLCRAFWAFSRKTGYKIFDLVSGGMAVIGKGLKGTEARRSRTLRPTQTSVPVENFIFETVKAYEHPSWGVASQKSLSACLRRYLPNSHFHRPKVPFHAVLDRRGRLVETRRRRWRRRGPRDGRCLLGQATQCTVVNRYKGAFVGQSSILLSAGRSTDHASRFLPPAKPLFPPKNQYAFTRVFERLFKERGAWPAKHNRQGRLMVFFPSAPAHALFKT